ncbi:hypothetical protein [Corallococcus llansteffanensis]|uniref:Uncharacterized protein n=1 Tax=Corallococcus llansteffanensis TaxID=2316731 RepID=A0A3A8NDR9_9BACT|nr:hypothetical protein [Corallococcus llansteffanensis]RKH41590.1 hypothetical protein D7V93_38570 [Corallococcus llansteffanensis]
MTDPASPPASDAAPLQFDQADYTEPPPAPRCTACERPISSTYYEVNSHLLCPECRETVEASLTGGSKSKRFLKASVFGFGAAVAGALVYFLVSLSGYNIGLIAVLVGWMVGTAVFKGSDGRGGWFYQLVAVVLTYLSVAASLAPEVYKGFEAQQAESVQAAAPTGGPAAQAPAAAPEAAGDAATPTSPEAAVVLTAIISVAAPVLVGIESPLSGLIYGFALYEAWRRNKKAVLNIAGPFKLADASGAEASEPQERSVG